MPDKKFVHLHVHTHYSLLDGLCKPKRLMKQVKKNNQEAVAITDHGVMYGCIDFYKNAIEAEVKPIIGCETYLARHGHLNKRPGIDVRPYHLTLLARNMDGYKDLLKLTTIAHLKGFYYKPRIDMELLKGHGKNLIGMSGCINGNIPQALLSGNEEEAVELLNQYQETFGKENFYIEVQDRPENQEQIVANKLLIDFSKSHKAPLVATNDVHYVKSSDSSAHDTLICIQTNSLVTDTSRMHYDGNFSLRSTEDMYEAFKDTPEALKNTVEIAKQCNIEFEFGKYLIPAFDVPEKKKPHHYLRELVYEGLIERYGIKVSMEALRKKKYKDLPEEDVVRIERAEYELDMIHDMGFDTYFLIVWDFIKHAKDNGIIVGPGRGSAAGAIIAYCLKITDIDPLRYDLLFERFLNPERVSMPDIDIDFQDDRRDEILEYVADKYGHDHVAQIITFGTMAARAAVKDVGRAHGIAFQKMNDISKLIPSRPGIKLKEALDGEPDLKRVYENDPEAHAVIDTALKLEGTIRHAGVHACAVVIAEKPLVNYTALQNAPGKAEGTITQYSMKPIDQLGLLKMDFLGLRNLTIIHKALGIIKRRHKKNIELNKIPLDDRRTFTLFSNGETTGVFQLESSGMKRYLKDLKPSQFEDIIAMVSLYRPGPMEFIPDYIAGKHGKKEVEYVHDDLKPILEKTYGIAVYQEQILQIAQVFAGFSLGEADILRRAIGKKIIKELKSQREKFIEGGVKQGYTKKLATEIFDKVIEPFANYGFNKSHAACYAMIAYQTAYLKAHYPAEFMAALLTAEQENSDRVAVNIEECNRMGISILPPDVNESLKGFTVIGDKEIRFGLAAIKNLGDDTIESIIKARKDGDHFKTIGEFANRLPHKCVNKKSLEALAKAGALDQFEERSAIIQSVDLISDYAKHQDAGKISGQTDIFGIMDGTDDSHILQLRKAEPASDSQKLAWEKEILGLYVSSHPLKGLKKYLKSRVKLIESLTLKDVDKNINLAGLVTNLRKITTKKRAQMATFVLEDPTGVIPVAVFPATYKEFFEQNIFMEDKFVVLGGKLDYRNNELQFVCRKAKKVSLEIMKNNAKEAGVYDENEEIKMVRSIPGIPEESPVDEDIVDVTEEVLKFGEGKGLLEDPPTPKPTEKKADKIKSETIKIIKTATKEDLLEVKKILEESRGENEVVLEVYVKDKWKKVPLSFNVDLDDKLKKRLESFLA